MASFRLCQQLERVRINVSGILLGMESNLCVIQKSSWLQSTVNRRTYLTRRGPVEPGWPGREETKFQTRWDQNPAVPVRPPVSPPLSCPPFCKDTQKYRNAVHAARTQQLVTYIWQILFLPGKYNIVGARGGAVGWGTVLQVGRWRVRFPIVSLEFFTMSLGSAQPPTEMSTRNISWEVKAIGA